MTAVERVARYRWGLQIRAALEKVARLIGEKPEGKTLPPLPKAIAKAYGLLAKR